MDPAAGQVRAALPESADDSQVGQVLAGLDDLEAAQALLAVTRITQTQTTLETSSSGNLRSAQVARAGKAVLAVLEALPLVHSRAELVDLEVDPVRVALLASVLQAAALEMRVSQIAVADRQMQSFTHDGPTIEEQADMASYSTSSIE